MPTFGPPNLPRRVAIAATGTVIVVAGSLFAYFRKETPSGPSATRNVICHGTSSGGTIWCLREDGSVAMSGATVIDGTTGVAYSPSTIELCSGTGDVLTVGDGKLQFTVPLSMSGYNLVRTHAGFAKAGRTGNSTFQISNKTKKRDMLSTVITVESTESGSHLATTPPVVNASNDDVGAFDNIWVDVDSASTAIVPQGTCVQAVFAAP